MRFCSIAAAAALLISSAVAAPVGDELEARALDNINNYECKATPGKDPIIFLHGLGAPSGVNWFTKAPIFAAEGYCVFTPQYGSIPPFFGWGSMRKSSKEIAGVVQKVLAGTGAEKVNLVGHSMGTTVSAYYMKFDGGDKYVNNFVGFGSNFKGTTMWGVNWLVRLIPGVSPALRAVCASCDEFLTPSPFMNDLAEGGITVKGPKYTSIVSKYDELVLPYTSGIIDEPGVTNIVIQEKCALDLVGHLLQATDPNVTKWIRWALDGKQGAVPQCLFKAGPFML